MKKGTVAIIITVVVCITILAIVGIVCAFDWLKDTTDTIIEDSEKATVSDKLMVGSNNITVDDIKNIRIEWVSGNITVKYYDGETIAVSESGVDEKYQMQCYKENGTFVVEEFKNNSAHINVKKNLELLIPHDFEIENFTIDSVSGRVNASAILAKNVVINTVSSNFNLQFSNQPDSISIDTVSGNLTIALPSNISGFSIDDDSVSGLVSTKDFGGKDTYGDGATKISLDSVSGSLKIRKEEVETSETNTTTTTKAPAVSFDNPANHAT
ncbi:MAG: DUF4097 family beta strand repeat-containing protein [Oscillospiraceae bacterium]|nr:DUF4097 family beta strand repeat-containing protein [Oscillospiraceae bacterium]